MPKPDTSHPGSDYYVNPFTGTIQRQGNTILAEALLQAGFTGPMTWEQAQRIVMDRGQAIKGARSAAGAVTGQNPLRYLAEIGHYIGLIISDLTDIHMWISLGWMLLGLGLFVMGILIWLRPNVSV